MSSTRQRFTPIAIEKQAISRTIGSVARRHRLARKMTQEDLGECLMVTAEFYARIERGLAMPSVATLCRLVITLQVKADVLLGLCEDPGPSAGTSDSEHTPGIDPNQWRKLIRRLQQAKPSTRQLISWLLDEMAAIERAQLAKRRRAKKAARC